jgi:oxygen-independent coproporphyrinogen-3 oxidase
VNDYLNALAREMKQAVKVHPNGILRTIFIGGGTPTSLNHQHMEFLLDTVNRTLNPPLSSVEFTVEANPGTVDAKLLQVMKRGGVNRLSFGVQSFDPRLLKRLGRVHSVQDVYHSIRLAREAGFDNISIDLMFGLPDQSLAQLEETIEQALTLDLPHISAYSLKIEEGTLYDKWYRENKLDLPDEDLEADMFELIIDRLTTAGYRHYEISNFARPGFESRHNLTYWRNEEYYGFGAGAHGYVAGIRYMNVKSVQEYIDQIDKKGSARCEDHPVSVKEAMEETMMLGLRLSEGVSSESFYQRFGVRLEEQYGQQLHNLLSKGLICSDGQRYRLTKKGIFLGNEVFAAFI